MPKVSAKATRRAELSAEKARAQDSTKHWKTARTTDSFQNFVAKLGIGTDNISSAGTYGFNPITRERTLLEWIHRGSWVAGMAVDMIADDMTRAGIEIKGSMPPQQIEDIDNLAQALNIWGSLRDAIAWGRLYGGALAVHMIDGQDYSTPLRVESVGKGQYRGLLALDRWMLRPILEDLVTDPGPNIGLPKFYVVEQNAPGLRGTKVHYTRVIRFGGNRLPYYQRLVENLWEESVLERLYDRLLAFDSTTTGAAQLVYKSYLRTYAIKNLRDVISTGGEAVNGLIQYVMMMAKFQSIEGVTLIDAEDKMEAREHTAFSGLAEVLVHLGQQISGAIQMPLVRLFGQSPSGLNATGESDLRTYYDMIASVQKREMTVGIMLTYRMMAQSLGFKTPQGFSIKFRPLWLITENERARIATDLTNAVSTGVEMGVPQDVALTELRQSADVTGVWSNISDEDIMTAKEDSRPPQEVEIAEIQRAGKVESAEVLGKAKIAATKITTKSQQEVAETKVEGQKELADQKSEQAVEQAKIAPNGSAQPMSSRSVAATKAWETGKVAP